MDLARSAITISTTGVKTFTCGFQPVEAELVVRIAPGASTAVVRKCFGTTDATNQNADSETHETTREFQQTFTDRMASIWEWNGTTWAETFRINFDSFTATEFKYNVVTANSAFQVLRIVRG